MQLFLLFFPVSDKKLLCSLTVNASWKTEGTQAEEKSYGFCQMKCESPKFL